MGWAPVKRVAWRGEREGCSGARGMAEWSLFGSLTQKCQTGKSFNFYFSILHLFCLYRVVS